MPSSRTTEMHKISSSFASIAVHSRSIISSFRHNQVVSMDQNQIQEDEFQSYVAAQLSSIAKKSLPPIQFLHLLLDSFLNIQNEFNNLLINNNPYLTSRTSSERLFSVFLDTSVKSLDICNEMSRVIQSICHWSTDARIVTTAVKNRQHERARRAISKLKLYNKNSFSRNWSFGKKLQAMPMSTGVEIAMYTMCYVMVFVMNALISAVGDVSISCNLVAPPKQLIWASPMVRVLEKMWKNEAGVSKEMEEEVNELMRSMDACKAMEIEEGCMRLEDDLVVLERRLRELFRRIVDSKEVFCKCLEGDVD